MAKRLRDYVKYSIKELEEYTQTEGSCVRKVNTNLHLSMGPFCLADFKHILLAHIVRSKVGFYDVHLGGIVLDVKKIKLMGTTGAIRADDPRIHVNVNADVYIFKPEEGAQLTGIVKHIGPHQVGVILYRVFNANLRVATKVDTSEVQMDQEVKFRIRKYNLQNVFPYIDGVLLTAGGEQDLPKAKITVFNQEDNGDSGIEEKDGIQELDHLMSIIKEETPSDQEALQTSSKSSKKKSKIAKSCSDDSAIAGSTSKSAKAKTPKKRKTISSTSSAITEDIDELLSKSLSKKVKRELSFSDASTPSTVKKIKKEKDESATKKRKRKTSLLEKTVEIKNEIEDE